MQLRVRAKHVYFHYVAARRHSYAWKFLFRGWTIMGKLKRFLARVVLFFAVFFGIVLVSSIAFTSETSGVMTSLGMFVSLLVPLF